MNTTTYSHNADQTHEQVGPVWRHPHYVSPEEPVWRHPHYVPPEEPFWRHPHRASPKSSQNLAPIMEVVSDERDV
jgi:hypothetical protein